MSTNNTQLISAEKYDTSSMIFSDPQEGSVPGNGPAISFSRINIQTRNPDGTIGELVMPTTRLFSFGVSENKNNETGKVNGWTLPLCLWSRDGATKEEKAWTETFDKIVEKCIDHIIQNKEELDKFELERNDLKKFNPLYWKKEKRMVNGKQQLCVVDGVGPTLYTKLIYSKKNNSFITIFRDVDGNEIDPLDMIGKYCFATSAIKIESIFIGNKISLQVKLYETIVEPVQQGVKRLLRPVAQTTVTQDFREKSDFMTTNPMNDDESDNGSILNDEEENEEGIPSQVKVIKKKVVVRKTVAKK